MTNEEVINLLERLRTDLVQPLVGSDPRWRSRQFICTIIDQYIRSLAEEPADA